MFRRFSVNFALFSMALDGVLVVVALFLSTWLRVAANTLSFVNHMPSAEVPYDLYLIFPVVWVFVLLLLSVYDGRRNFRVADELGSLTLASFLASICIAGVLYLSYREISRFQFLIFICCSYVPQVVWRLSARQVFRWRNANVSQRRVLIAGCGVVGLRVAGQIERNPYLGLDLVGYLDDDEKKRAGCTDILGMLKDVRRVIDQYRVEDVVIALPRSAHARVTELVAVLHDLPVKVWVIPDYFSLALHQATVEEFAGLPMLDLRAPALNDYQRMTKRAFDLAVAGMVMIPAALVMSVAALAIRLEEPGPIFFRQKRVGENGRLFDMIKFRTMVVGADKMLEKCEVVDGNGRLMQVKRPDDHRVTRVGRWLRRTSIDELPQLWNVLKGDMSLIGPRPELPEFVERYEQWQRKRFAVPQGMTGWWQVQGRSDKPMHLNTEDDLYYVQHYSLWLDVQILMKTVWVVLRGKGAY